MLPLVVLAFAAGPLNGPLPPGAIARLGTLNPNYIIGITSAAFSKDGSHIYATCSFSGNYFSETTPDYALCLWNAKTRCLVEKVSGRPYGAAWSVRPHPRGGLVLCAGQFEMALRDVKARKTLWQTSVGVADTAWGQRGRWFLADDDRSGQITLRDGNTGKEVRRVWEGTRWVAAFAASPTQQKAALLESKGALHLFDPFTGRKDWQVQTRPKGGYDDKKGVAAFDSRGEWLLAGGPDGPVRLWRVRDGKPGHVLFKGPDWGARAAAFAADGRVGLGFERGVMCLFDSRTGKELRRWRTMKGLRGLAFSPDSRTVITWHEFCPRLQFWDCLTGKLLNPHDGRDEFLTGVEWAGGGAVITRGWSGQATRWDVDTGKATSLPLRPFPVRGVERSPDARFHAVSDEEGLTLVDRGGKRRRLVKWKEELTRTFGFSRNGDWLAATLPVLDDPNSDIVSKVVLWDTRTGKQLLECKGISSWSISPDGKSLLVVEEGHGFKAIEPGREEKTLMLFETGLYSDPPASQWSSDSRLVAIAWNDWVYVLGAREGKALRVLGFDSMARSLVMSFSADNRQLAIARQRDCASLWEVSPFSVNVFSLESGHLLHEFKGHKGFVSGLAFSPRGDMLASSSEDGSVLLWDLTGRMRRPCQLTAESFAGRWKKLASANAIESEPALWDIVYCPEAPNLLRKVVRPQRGMAAERLKHHVAGLDADDFETRARAEAALLAHGPGATRALRETAETTSSLEGRLRIQRILRRWATAPEARRLSRAVLALEKLGTPEAKGLLKKLAAGEPGAPLTVDAKAALKRLTRP